MYERQRKLRSLSKPFYAQLIVAPQKSISLNIQCAKNIYILLLLTIFLFEHKKMYIEKSANVAIVMIFLLKPKKILNFNKRYKPCPKEG